MQPPYFFRRGFPPSENELVQFPKEGNKAAALEATSEWAISYKRILWLFMFDLFNEYYLAVISVKKWQKIYYK